jgi:hypothetical protein
MQRAGRTLAGRHLNNCENGELYEPSIQGSDDGLATLALWHTVARLHFDCSCVWQTAKNCQI